VQLHELVKNEQPARKKMGTINELSASWVLSALWQIALLALTESDVAGHPASTSAGHRFAIQCMAELL
jgi:hypothetical protein